MQQQKFQDSGYAPSFSCYSSDSITSTAVAKVIREEQVARFQGEDFEFSIDEQVSAKETYSRGWTVFKHDLLLVNDETKTKDDEIDASSATTVGGRWKTQSPVHEQFYVQRRAENEVGKRKSYLPYRKDLVGLFANVNGMGKMLPF
ncbi:hypothetical protein L1987_17868 [Smallanthus sonchifolius]|uniref:Uncharacterized protein n=1 Tax=Smallanthus sonchifolius TaxID=185202 RepID=A0ACB9J0B9_9ASTR|nr:hypothetical protein L1987_17868 [Smallanthus sonchifolius]